MLILTTAVSSAVLYTHLAWWKALFITALWASVLILWMLEHRKTSARNALELDLWLSVGGDLRITSEIVRGAGDHNLPIMKAGPGFKRVLGWASEEMEGTPWQSFIHPDDLGTAVPEVHKLADGTDLSKVCNRWRHKQPHPDGEPRWVWLEWTATTSKELKLTYANAQDMTSRFEREAQMSTWSRISNDLMSVADLSVPPEERKFEWVNEAWTRQLGWTQHELYSMRIMDLINPPEREWVLAHRTSIEESVDGQVRDPIECKVLCKPVPGEPLKYLLFEWTGFDTNGKVYVNGRNAEAEHHHRVAMAKAISDLEARNLDLERFASVAAHQLRSPPRTIAGIAQALTEDYGHLLDEEGLQFLEDIRNDGDQMAEIVDGLFRFSKVRTSADMHIEPVDLNALIHTIYESKKKRGWEGDDRDLYWDAMPTVLGDEMLLTEVFLNLVDNGFKFNASKHKKVQISAVRSDDRWFISVKDNGIGIDPAYHHKLFTMFERVHPSYPGTGVGLALVQAIVNKLCGEITVKSAPDKGTTFTFDLEGAWTE